MSEPSGTSGAPQAQGREVEMKFVIAAEDPRRVRERLQGLTEIAGFRLVPLPVRRMRDVYYDTEDRALRSNRVALRLRTVADETWITVKGEATMTPSGFLDRREIELPWSDDALRRILVDLGGLGVRLVPVNRSPASDDPEASLECLGLRPIQDRTTERAVRDLRPARSGAPAGSVGEMCLDTVKYRAGDREVHHDEIELEVRKGEDPAALGPFVTELNERFGRHLRPWHHDKLVSGLALEDLSARGQISPLVDASDHLRAVAYDFLDRTIRSRA
jgi:inorganic triphosphatase YgiF